MQMYNDINYELYFQGEVYTVVDNSDVGWWTVRNKNG